MKHGLSWKSYNIPHDFPVPSVHFLSLFFFPILPDPTTAQGENADHCDQPKVAAVVEDDDVVGPEVDDDDEAVQNFPE